MPPGSRYDAGCTPLLFGYTFDAWPGPFSESQVCAPLPLLWPLCPFVFPLRALPSPGPSPSFPLSAPLPFPSFPSPGPLSLAFTLPPPLFSNTQMFIIPHPTKTEKNYGYSVSGVIGEGRGGRTGGPCPGGEDESHLI